MKIRMMMAAVLAAAFAVSAAAAECGAPEKNDAKAGVKKARNSSTTYAADALKPFVDSGELPGAISVLYKNGVQEIACVGWADVDKKIPMSLDRTFMQCSQTKGFCGVTVAMLVEEGKISLDDPVSKYLPELKDLKVAVKGKNGKTTVVPAKNVMTIRMAMNHTAGFPFEVPTKMKEGIAALPLRDTVREAAANPLLFEPGTKIRYSDTGIDVGAAVVEVVTGKPWDVFLKERVLDPLGMTETTFNPTDEQLARAISMYDTQGGKKAKFRLFHHWLPLPHNGKDVHPSAGGGLWTTAPDQLKFYKMLMNLGVGENGVRILKEETVKNLLATSTRPAGMEGYSLGLHVKNTTMGHGGAFGTRCRVDWREKTIRLWVVQQRSKNRTWLRAWDKASAKFFAAEVDDSEKDPYTNRVK